MADRLRLSPGNRGRVDVTPTADWYRPHDRLSLTDLHNAVSIPHVQYDSHLDALAGAFAEEEAEADNKALAHVIIPK